MKFKFYISLIGLLTITSVMAADTKSKTEFDGVASFDRTVYDFGDILISQGPVSCKFIVTNISKKPIVIFNVVSSCGCTEVKWTREPVLPGKKGEISATYSNDEGIAAPFDKTLTVYISDVKKPIVLRLRGVSHKKKLALEEIYGTRFGDLAFKDPDIKCGNLEQGLKKSGEITVANLGSGSIKAGFKNVSPGMTLSVSPNPIPARSIAKVFFTISASRERWGRNYYYATPTVNGRAFKAAVAKTREQLPDSERGALNAQDINKNLGNGKEDIGIWAFTKENFSLWSQAQIDSASEPLFQNSNCSFGKIKKGKTVDAVFKASNLGKSPFVVYKVDSDYPLTSNYIVPDIAPGGKADYRFRVDTSDLPLGEAAVILTLTTNSPLRPLVDLFIVGFVIE